MKEGNPIEEHFAESFNETSENTAVFFSFDNLNILGTFGKQVHIKGEYYDESAKEGEEFKSCVLIFTRSLLKKALDCWLNDKKDYCERWNEYCGVMGSIRSEDYVQAKMPIELLDFDEEKYEKDENYSGEYKKVPAFFIKSFEEFTDMEHG